MAAVMNTAKPRLNAVKMTGDSGAVGFIVGSQPSLEPVGRSVEPSMGELVVGEWFVGMLVIVTLVVSRARTKLHNETEGTDYTDTDRFVWYPGMRDTGVPNSGFRYRPGIQTPNGCIETNLSFGQPNVCIRIDIWLPADRQRQPGLIKVLYWVFKFFSHD
jgi:hypothetical protein